MEWIPVVVTFFLGLVSALGIEFGKGQLERWQRRTDQAANFQWETLRDLQEALFEVRDSVARIDLLQQEHWRETAEWRAGFLYDQEQGNEFARRCARVRVLASRVRNQEIREGAITFVTAAVESANASNRMEAWQIFKDAERLNDQVIARIGDELRRL